MTPELRLEEIFAAIELSRKEGFEVPPPKDVLDGFSGAKLAGLLQRLGGLYPCPVIRVTWK